MVLFAFSSAARADDPQAQVYQHALADGQPILMDVTDDIKADVHVTAWDRPNVDITVAPSGHYADSVRLTGLTENGTVAMHVTASPSPHKGFFGWLAFYRPDARIEMHVPRDATLSVHVINGPIVIDNVTGQLRVGSALKREPRIIVDFRPNGPARRSTHAQESLLRIADRRHPSRV
jgi:hypothetical protein